MKRVLKYVVVPFHHVRGRFHVGEMRKAGSEEHAIGMAEAMAGRFAGVAAFEVVVDDETSEMHDPRLLAVFGRVPDPEAMAA